MRPLTLLAIPAALLVAAIAGAQERTADDLFQEATQLFARGEIKSACDKFAASYKVDASPGTLFNMAVCHEKDSRLWQARSEFLDFADRAVKVHKPEAAQPAVEHLTAIEVKLPKIQLAFPAHANVASIVVDGTVLEPEAWKKPIPVDAAKSEHSVDFRAPGTTSETRKVTTGADGAVTKVDVPVLAVDGAPPPPLPPVEGPAPPPPAASHSNRTLGFVVAGGGVAALAVGGVFGGLTLGQNSNGQPGCSSQTRVCTDQATQKTANDALHTAQTDSWISTIGLGVGVVAVGVGAYLLFTGSKAEAPSTSTARVRVLPTMGRDGGGLVLAGPF